MTPIRAFLASFAAGLFLLSAGHGVLANMIAAQPDVQVGPIGDVTAA